MAKIMNLVPEWTPEEEKQAAEIRAMLEKENEDADRAENRYYVEKTYVAAVVISILLFAYAFIGKIVRMSELAVGALISEYGVWWATVYIFIPIVTVGAFWAGVAYVLLKLPCWLSMYAEASRKHLKRCIYKRYSLRKAWRRELKWNLPAFVLLSVVRLLSGKKYHRLFEEGGAL